MFEKSFSFAFFKNKRKTLKFIFQGGYQVSNAPWSLDSQNDYPTLGGPGNGAPAASPWGPRK